MNTYSTIRKYSLLLIGFLFLSIQVNGQVDNSFDVHTISSRFGAKPVEHFNNNGFKSNTKLMAESVITSNKTTVNIPSVIAWLDKYLPSPTSSDYLILNWETGPYDALRNNPVGSPKFIAAENELLKLLNTVKSYRPNVKISIYQLPYRVNTIQQNKLANTPGKFDKIFTKIDFICPSVYNENPNEAVANENNLRSIKFNLDVALPLGKQFNKPVYPFVWHYSAKLKSLVGALIVSA